MFAALPSHHDDDHGGALRRIAAGHRHGRGLGTAQAAGITIVGGLIVSQMLTLFTTPVVYLFFDRLQWRVMKLRRIGAELEGAAAD